MNPEERPSSQRAAGLEPAELSSCRRAFLAAPSFTTLRKLAELWSETQHWELAAEAWLHVAHARPHDAQAYAGAAQALSHLERHEAAARVWEQACRIQPQNAQYADAHARAVRDSKPPVPQTNESVGRSR
jgi:tetratricopeptide (TPR) repeat protein